jgi:peroxiredoxin
VVAWCCTRIRGPGARARHRSPPTGTRFPEPRGCSNEACSFRDHHAEIRAADADVLGLSTQDPNDQQEAVQRLRLTYLLVSDADLQVTQALSLPTFEVAGQTLLRRLTLVVRDGVVEHVWYPVFPPDGHAEQVLAWLRERE